MKHCTEQLIYFYFCFPALCRHGEGVLQVDLEGVHTNIVMVEVIKSGLTAENFADRLAQVGIN